MKRISKIKASFGGNSASKQGGVPTGKDGVSWSAIAASAPASLPKKVETVVLLPPTTHVQLPTIVEPDVPRSGDTTLGEPTSPPRAHSSTSYSASAPSATGRPKLAAKTYLFNEKQIEKIWKSVEERVLRMAGDSESKVIQENLGIDGVLKQLDSVKQSDKKAAEKYAPAKDVFDNSLKFIESLGSIVSNSISSVSTLPPTRPNLDRSLHAGEVPLC